MSVRMATVVSDVIAPWEKKGEESERMNDSRTDIERKARRGGRRKRLELSSS